ncbi:MAG TPA: hypothetical protein VFI15_05130 [Candidatus Limnocylindrales bacterium]|nr:hypothetical protein [Candidatus Limnocylindrales bacterium]
MTQQDPPAAPDPAGPDAVAPVSAAPAPPPVEPPVYVAPPAAAPVLVPGRRTPLAAAAGVILLVLGVLGAIFAIAILTIGRGIIDAFDFSTIPGMEGVNDPGAVIGSVVSFIAILLLVFSAFYAIGGVGAMRSAGWGRVIGIVIGLLGGLFWLAAVSGSSRAGTEANPLIAIVLLAVHAYVFVVLAFFWRSKPSLA